MAAIGLQCCTWYGADHLLRGGQLHIYGVVLHPQQGEKISRTTKQQKNTKSSERKSRDKKKDAWKGDWKKRGTSS